MSLINNENNWPAIKKKLGSKNITIAWKPGGHKNIKEDKLAKGTESNDEKNSI